MSVLPLMLDGSKFSALVVGGGAVALRKARALLDGDVRVTVVAPDIEAELRELASREPRLSISAVRYEPSQIGDFAIVVAATDDAMLNAGVARDALGLNRLVNVVDDPDAGSFTTPAVHRSGDLTVAVSAGRLPAAAAAIRDTIADRFDTRYAHAIAELRGLRDRLLANGGREEWKAASAELLGESFCSGVESGSIEPRVGSWP